MAKGNEWRTSFSRLVSHYKSKKGRAESNVSKWLDDINHHYDKLSSREQALLKRLGFISEVRTNWNEMFSHLASFYQKHGHSYVPSGQKGLDKLFDWTIGQKLAKPRLSKAQIRQLESVDFDWGTSSDYESRWQNQYSDLLSFKRQFGHARVPQDMQGHEKLARWVSLQRRKKTKKELPTGKIKLLNAAGFLWKEDIAKQKEQAWEDRYQELIAYQKIHRHLDRRTVIKDNYQLGLWMETQIGRGDRLLPARRKKLLAIGFRLDKGDLFQERWNHMFEQLRAYKKAQGHTQVKQRENFKLSVWLQRQKRDKAELPAAQRDRLEKLGVLWSREYSKSQWKLRYDELKAFKKRHGHLNVTRQAPELYEWIQTQKRSKVEGTLATDREVKLNQLGLTWKGERAKQDWIRWETMMSKFERFKKKFGEHYILELKNHPDLNHWFNRQIHNKHKLSEAKRNELSRIGFPWRKKDLRVAQLWEQRYQMLVNYKKIHGHCDVSQYDAQNRVLGVWCNAQKNRSLSKEQMHKLDKLGFKWSGELLNERWENRLNAYLELKRKNRLHLLRSHTPLRSWMYQQRKNFKSLPLDKRRKLRRSGLVN